MKKLINKSISRQILLLLFFCVSSIYVFGQKKSDKYKAEARELQNKINYTKQLLGSTQNKEKKTMSELNILNQQIAYRDELIKLYILQIQSLEFKIIENKDIIESLNEDLKVLKQKYAKMVYYAYKLRNSYDKTYMVWLSGKELHKAYLREKYLNQLTEYRKIQVQYIHKTKEQLNYKQVELEENIKEKQLVLTNWDIEKQAYESDKLNQKEVLASLEKEENRLKRQLNDQEKSRDRLKAAIEKAIAEEQMDNTPKAVKLGKNFASNKGQLPWPVDKGEITSLFGVHAHRIITDGKEDNPGIDITTSSHAVVKSVFAGRVSKVFIIPGDGKAVMITHGNYRTVYAKLKDIYVKIGDEVETQQEIGVLLKSTSSNISVVHFQIWQVNGGSAEKLNPSYWLRR